MSNLNEQDIAKWKEDNMSCQMCKHYAGIGYYCLQAHYVHNACISISCKDYEYNGELKYEE